MGQLPQFFELTDDRGLRGTSGIKASVNRHDPISRVVDELDLIEDYECAISNSVSPLGYLAIRGDELMPVRQREREWKARMLVYQGYLNGDKIRTAEDQRDIQVCEFCDWRFDMLQRSDTSDVMRSPHASAGRSRPYSGGSARASGTSRWNEAYHNMSSAVATANSDAGSNLDFDASEVSSVLETSAGRRA